MSNKNSHNKYWFKYILALLYVQLTVPIMNFTTGTIHCVGLHLFIIPSKIHKYFPFQSRVMLAL